MKTNHGWNKHKTQKPILNLLQHAASNLVYDDTLVLLFVNKYFF